MSMYRYQFARDVAIEEIEVAIVRAVMIIEALHGEACVRLDAAHHLDPDKRTCVVDAGTRVGRDFNRVLVSHLRREIGDDAFSVRRIRQRLHARSDAARA